MARPGAQQEYGHLRQAVLLGLFVGTGVGLGYLLAGIPGLELMSLNAALAGAALGPFAGAAAGFLSALAYSLGSPFGPPVPLLLAAQVTGMALCGFLGGLLSPLWQRMPAALAAGLAGGGGLFAALSLDLLTNVAIAVSLRLPVPATLLLGLPVAALHAGTTALAFALLLPPLSRRLQRLLRCSPRATTVLCLALLFGPTIAAAQASQDDEPEASAQPSLAEEPAPLPEPAPADSTAARLPAAAADGRLVNGWRRPLWQPFAASLRDELGRTGHWVPVGDGGQGAAVVYFGEPGTASAPLWLRDGLPLGIGHRFLDDPEAISIAGHDVKAGRFGLADDGSLAGTVELQPRDPRPGSDLTDTRWFKGAHETYLREVHFLTAAAPWRLGFAFAELLDNEGYDFRVPGETRYAELDESDPRLRGILWGEAKLRSGLVSGRRDLGAAGALTFSWENVRKLKRALPAYGLDHQDLWHNRASVDWRRTGAGRSARLALWWLDSDVDWNRGRASYRKQEGSRTGALATWGKPEGAGQLTASYERWVLVDSGADSAWAYPDDQPLRLAGERASLRAARAWPLGAAALRITAGCWWDQHGGWLGGGSARLAAAAPAPHWSLTFERGGRAPRSDELATAWRYVVPDGRRTVVLPNRNLRRQEQWRLAADGTSTLAGFALAISGALSRLRDGIGWRPLAADTTAGRWDNGLDLDAATIRASLAREGRCLGWLQLRADATWRTWHERGDLRAALPPAWDWRLSVLWEEHFFQEDGILQLGWYLHNRGDCDDPWFLAAPVALPTLTRLDMIVGFRLVGTDLGLEIRNLAGAGQRESAGALAGGREQRRRLPWVVHY